MAEIKLPERIGEAFTRQAVVLDGTRFVNCRFIDCQLIYCGGPSDCSACEFFGSVTWNFQGPASKTVVVLQAFGWKLSFAGSEARMITQSNQ